MITTSKGGRALSNARKASRRRSRGRDRVPLLVEGTLHQLAQGRIPLNGQHADTRLRRWQGGSGDLGRRLVRGGLAYREMDVEGSARN